jgi:hypothetical protein
MLTSAIWGAEVGEELRYANGSAGVVARHVTWWRVIGETRRVRVRANVATGGALGRADRVWRSKAGNAGARALILVRNKW